MAERQGSLTISQQLQFGRERENRPAFSPAQTVVDIGSRTANHVARPLWKKPKATAARNGKSPANSAYERAFHEAALNPGARSGDGSVRHRFNSEPPGGMSETGTSAIVPAIANAIIAAAGQRLRRMPVDASVLKRPV